MPCGGDPARGQHHGAEEVRRGGPSFQLLLDQLLNVVPELPQLVPLPAVSALIERHLVLLLALDEFVECGLLSVHARLSPCRVPDDPYSTIGAGVSSSSTGSVAATRLSGAGPPGYTRAR